MWVTRENEEGSLKKWRQCEYNLQTEKYNSHFTPTPVDSASKDSTNFKICFLIYGWLNKNTEPIHSEDWLYELLKSGFQKQFEAVIMILVVLCYKIHTFGQTAVSKATHHVCIKSTGWNRRQAEYQYGTIARVECTSALHKRKLWQWAIILVFSQKIKLMDFI